MSLLMKALEKAAKDRGEARAQKAETPPPPAEPELAPKDASPPPAKAAPAAEQPLGMKPIPAPASELTLEPLGAPPPRQPADAPSSPAPREPAPAPERTPPAPRAAANPSPEQDRAAAVLQAGSRPPGGVGAYLKSHPVALFGGLAGLFAIGFGVYIYLQIFHPGFFVRQATAPKPSPVTQAPAQPPAPASSPSVPPPLASAPLLQGPETGGVAAPVAPPAAPTAPAAPPRAPLTAAAPQAPAPVEPAAPHNSIVISAGSPAPKLDPVLARAYEALAANRLDAAQALYEQQLKASPRNVDALLGLAAIAQQAGKSDEATQNYMRILEIEPRNAFAQSGLIALLGRANPLAAESRLKQLIAREPSAYLYFTLGNLYADQSLWAQAQHAYFQAYHLEASNPDYAYNLAVGLEHVSQGKLAHEYYQRAVALAAKRPHVNFDVARARERVSKLADPAK